MSWDLPCCRQLLKGHNIASKKARLSSKLSIRAAVETMVNAIINAFPTIRDDSKADSKSGRPWKNEWVDLVRFNSQGKITQMKEFFDTGHVHNHLEELESESKNAK